MKKHRSKVATVIDPGIHLDDYWVTLFGEIINKKGDKQISLTERGLRFLEKYKTIIDFIDEFEL